MKQIPYGIDDFERIIQEDYYYIDKSEYIRTVEKQASYVLLVRPRRMGKSLFTNMLMAYYDILNKDKFEKLFGHLVIGQKPTEWANKFMVLKLDFSMVENQLENLEKDFTEYCFNQLSLYFKRYRDIYSMEEREEIMGCSSIKAAIVQLTSLNKLKGLRTYLFIDEYDNFTNTILAARGVKAHEAITRGDGFYRNFFQGCKGTFERIFMTGVSPVTYDDLTSGFHIADVVALLPKFNQAIGVTETELREMIEYYRSQGQITRTADDIITEIKPWYDNFCFSSRSYGVDPTIYNTDMVLRYLKELISEKLPPENMVDYAARTDPKKLDHLVLSEDLANREERINIINEICAKGYTTGVVEPEFPARDCGDERNFKSMLYYYGTITFGGWEDGEPRLIVPNKNMGDLYLDYMLKLAQDQGLQLNGKYKELQSAIREAAVEGKWQPMAEVIGRICQDYASVRNEIRGEWDLQGFLRGLLCLNRYYDVWPELELGHGFSDILLVPRGNPECPTRHSYIIEVKYVGLEKKGKKGEKDSLEDKVKEAGKQLAQYVADHHLCDGALLRGTDLTPLCFVFKGHRLVVSREMGIVVGIVDKIVEMVENKSKMG
ncbi:MAG: ATP-binding protein [Bacteroidales bacterium]|nr:ATP-binding protein [Bacteroidales bacterium]